MSFIGFITKYFEKKENGNLASHKELENKNQEHISIKEKFDELNNINKLKYIFSKLEYDFRELELNENEIHIPKIRMEYQNLMQFYLQRSSDQFISVLMNRVKVSFGSIMKDKNSVVFQELLQKFELSLKTLEFEEIELNNDESEIYLKKDNKENNDTFEDEEISSRKIETSSDEIKLITSRKGIIECNHCDREIKKTGWKKHIAGKVHQDNMKS